MKAKKVATRKTAPGFTMMQNAALPSGSSAVPKPVQKIIPLKKGGKSYGMASLKS
jgi:hypothetical protein